MNKLMRGVVINNTHVLNGTLVVRVTTEKYDKFYRRIRSSSRVYIVHHATKQPIELNTRVFITQVAPISKLKKHAIVSGNKKTC